MLKIFKKNTKLYLEIKFKENSIPNIQDWTSNT